MFSNFISTSNRVNSYFFFISFFTFTMSIIFIVH